MKKESFGQRLSRLRKEKGLTQEDIANRITISPQAVSKWENDVSSPDIDYLTSLADILGVSVDELLGRKEETKASKEPQAEASETADEVVDDEDKKSGDRIVINDDGVHLEDDDGGQVHITEEGVEVIDEDGHSVRRHKFGDYKPHPSAWIVPSVVGALALIGYILLGLLWTDAQMGWRMGWLLLLLVPIASSIENAIWHKKICNFAYPILVIGAYIALGFLGQHFGFRGWDFYWFLFLTIPAFYLIFSPIDKYVIHKNDNKKE